MRNPIRHIAAILCLLILNAVLFASPTVEYKVSMVAPWTHYLNVEMRISGLKAKQTEVKMAVWTPGSYLVRDYSRHIDIITAEGKNGKAQTISKAAKNTWLVELNGQNETVIKYSIYCNEHTVRTPYVNAKHASIIPAGTFLYLADYEGPMTVEIQPYKEWNQITTALPQKGNNKWLRTASNLDILLDSPIEIGNQEVYEFDAIEIPHSLAVVGEGNFDKTQVIDDIKKIVEKATNIFGSNPNDNYTFILHNTAGDYGGLEHLNSTSLIYRRWGYDTPLEYRTFMGLVSHEYFHLWNVKRIRPIELGPFDYEKENYTTGLWISEGVTSYYDDLLLLRAGIVTGKEYLKIASANMNNAGNRAGDKVQAVAHSSYDAWIKYYRQDENSGNTTVSYYGKGAVIAMALDIHILALSKGEKRLDDVMKALWQQYLKDPSKGFTEAEFQEIVEKVAGKKMDDFFQDHVYGTKQLDYTAYFEAIGIKAHDKLKEQNGIRLGAGINGSNVLTRVVRELPAYNSGLNVDDEILAIDGFRYVGDIREQLSKKSDGDIMNFLLNRDGIIMNVKVALYPTQRYDFSLSKVEEPTELQNQLYEKWLSEE
jgi:predicted metalloprotease with PDZ domain